MRTWGTKADNTAPAASGVLTAAEDNVRGTELNNAVTSFGITLDPTIGPDADLTMLAQAMSRSTSLGIFGTFGGTANVQTLTALAGVVPPKALFTGMKIAGWVVTANTGATTLNAFGLGAKKVLDWFSAECAGGELGAARYVEIIYDTTLDGGAGAWRILPWATAARPHFRLKENSTQTITTATLTRYTNLGTTEYSYLRNSTLTSSRFTCSGADAGYWLFNFQGNILNDTSEQLILRKNGTSVHLATQVIGSSTVQMLAWIGFVAAGDQMELWGYHAAGANRDTTGDNFLAGVRLF
ncbi:MAG: hypothetical protein NW216_07640 [Hyphomicrobium sp.]|nr:hypothetical protein [Hyphomicrobium sp.]